METIINEKTITQMAGKAMSDDEVKKRLAIRSENVKAILSDFRETILVKKENNK